MPLATILRPMAALALAAATLAPIAASADQRGYAHVHRQTQQQGVDPAVMGVLGALVDEILISTQAGLDACMGGAGAFGSPQACDCLRRHLTIRGEMHRFNHEVCGR